MSKYINKHRIFFILFKFKNLVENIIGLKIQLKNKNNFISRTVPEYRYIPIANYLFKKGPLNLLEVGAHRGFLIDQFKNNIMPTGIKMLDMFYVHKSIYPKR